MAAGEEGFGGGGFEVFCKFSRHLDINLLIFPYQTLHLRHLTLYLFLKLCKSHTRNNPLFILKSIRQSKEVRHMRRELIPPSAITPLPIRTFDLQILHLI